MPTIVGLIAGGVLLALGLASGALLVLSPIELFEAPGFTLWVFFPVLTLLGYLFLAVASPEPSVAAISRISGALLVFLALSAVTMLFLIGASVIVTSSGTLSLWYVLALGLVMGTTGLAIPRLRPPPPQG